jgi:hypothetical protein
MIETVTWQDGDRVELRPNADNPLHKKPVMATYQGGYFYCDGSDPTLGPDYYLGDVLAYCEVVCQS